MQGRVVLAPENQRQALLPRKTDNLGLSTCVKLACLTATTLDMLELDSNPNVAWTCNVTTLEKKQKYGGGCALRAFKNLQLYFTHAKTKTESTSKPEWVQSTIQNMPAIISELLTHGEWLRKTLSEAVQEGVPNRDPSRKLKDAIFNYFTYAQNLCRTHEEFEEFIKLLPLEGFLNHEDAPKTRDQQEFRNYFNDLVTIVHEEVEELAKPKSGGPYRDYARILTYNLMSLFQHQLVKLNGSKGELSTIVSIDTLPETTVGIVQPLAMELVNLNRVGVTSNIDGAFIKAFVEDLRNAIEAAKVEEEPTETRTVRPTSIIQDVESCSDRQEYASSHPNIYQPSLNKKADEHRSPLEDTPPPTIKNHFDEWWEQAQRLRAAEKQKHSSSRKDISFSLTNLSRQNSTVTEGAHYNWPTASPTASPPEMYEDRLFEGEPVWDVRRETPTSASGGVTRMRGFTSAPLHRSASISEGSASMSRLEKWRLPSSKGTLYPSETRHQTTSAATSPVSSVAGSEQSWRLRSDSFRSSKLNRSDRLDKTRSADIQLSDQRSDPWTLESPAITKTVQSKLAANPSRPPLSKPPPVPKTSPPEDSQERNTSRPPLSKPPPVPKTSPPEDSQERPFSYSRATTDFENKASGMVSPWNDQAMYKLPPEPSSTGYRQAGIGSWEPIPMTVDMLNQSFSSSLRPDPSLGQESLNYSSSEDIFPQTSFRADNSREEWHRSTSTRALHQRLGRQEGVIESFEDRSEVNKRPLPARTQSFRDRRTGSTLRARLPMTSPPSGSRSPFQ